MLTLNAVREIANYPASATKEELHEALEIAANKQMDLIPIGGTIHGTTEEIRRWQEWRTIHNKLREALQ